MFTSKNAITRIEVAAIIVLAVIATVGGTYYLSTTLPTLNLPALGSIPTSIPKYNLSDAITAGYIEANITGYSGIDAIFGASSGDCIILNIKRLVNFTIEIEPITTGTLLMTSGDAQNMAVLNLRGLNTAGYHHPRDSIILDTPKPVQYLFSGYCVTFDKQNPTSATLFNQSGMADANVLKIYSILDQLPANVTSIAAIQTAVFVVTDDVSLSDLQNKFPTGAAEIGNARAILEKAGIDISNASLFT